MKNTNNEAKCPNNNCNGIDSCFFVDDCTFHKCDLCETTWKTYDPQNRIEKAFDIVLAYE